VVKYKSKKFIELRKEEDKLRQLIKDNQFNTQYLEENFGIKKEDIDSLYTYAKFQYECGRYDEAIDYLAQYRRLILDTDPPKELMSLWGILASLILMSRWREAEDHIVIIRDLIEDQKLSHNPLKQLQLRLWLIHWSLFVYFHSSEPNGFIGMLDFFLGNDRYLRAIELKAPWILRYLTVAAILKKHRLTDLVRIIKQESANYSDPITEYIRCLYVKFDFEGAERELEKCEDILKKDYFIKDPESDVPPKEILLEFMNNARYSICEAFCKIHSTIDIKMMSNKLRLPVQESEWWIVNLIRGAKLDAKIDSAKDLVIVSSQAPSVYQQLLDKTKTLSLRASVLASNLERGKIKNQKEEKLNDERDE